MHRLQKTEISHLSNWMNYLFVLAGSKRWKYRAGFKTGYCKWEVVHHFSGLSLLRMLDVRLPCGPSCLSPRGLTRGGRRDPWAGWAPEKRQSWNTCRGFVWAEDAAVVRHERLGKARERLWFGNTHEIPWRMLPMFLFESIGDEHDSKNSCQDRMTKRIFCLFV